MIRALSKNYLQYSTCESNNMVTNIILYIVTLPNESETQNRQDIDLGRGVWDCGDKWIVIIPWNSGWHCVESITFLFVLFKKRTDYVCTYKVLFYCLVSEHCKCSCLYLWTVLVINSRLIGVTVNIVNRIFTSIAYHLR